MDGETPPADQSIDTDLELTDIDGIGPSTADDLTDAGFDSVYAIAVADADALESVSGFKSDRALEVHEQAYSMVEEDYPELLTSEETLEELPDEEEFSDALDGEEADEEDTGTSSKEDVEEVLKFGEDADEEEAGDEESTTGDVVDETAEADIVEEEVDEENPIVPINLELSAKVYPHIVGSAVEKMVLSRQRNDIEAEQSMERIMIELVEAYVDEDTITLTTEVTPDECDLLHQAFSATMSDYRSRAGITGLWEDVQTVRDDVLAQRTEYLS